MRSHNIEQLASLILYHKMLYYKGKSTISNEEFDALEAKLKSLSPHHPVLDFVGYSLTHQKQKIKHHIPMLSLAKTYEKSDLLHFLNQYECVAMDKFDGMALSLEYDGEGKLIQASTRGNGEFGENVTEHVYHILSIPKILTLPNRLHKHRIEIRGEIYFPLSEFNKFKEQFDSFRNAVPGTLGRKDVNEAAYILRTFLFCPFDILIFDQNNHPLDINQTAKLCDINKKYSEKFNFIQTLGFKLLENFVFKLNHFAHKLTEVALDQILETLFMQKRDHEIDGLVFRIEDEELWENLGHTAHHPRGSLAFKRAGETAITEILDIEPNVGRSGKISFRAKLQPVFLSSAKISHATLHNADYIEKGHYDIGAKVQIIRSGEVIPAILKRIDHKKSHYKLPTQCLCGSPLERKGPDLWCLKKGACEYSNQENLVHFVHVFEMLGISDRIVHKFREAGLVKEPADFYKISIEDILELEGFGKKSAQNIVDVIQSKKKVPLWQFLTALGLRRGGEVKCKEVARKFQTIQNVLSLTEVDLFDQKGWAQKSAADFIQSIQSKHQIINNLLKYVHVVQDHSSKLVDKNSAIFGKHICITGTLSKPRSEIKAILEKSGAKIVSSVSANTDYLLCNEISDSTKYQDAKKLKIAIITEDDLNHLI